MTYEVRIIGPDAERVVMTTVDFETAMEEVRWQRNLTKYAVIIRDCSDGSRWSFNDLETEDKSQLPLI